MRRTVRDEAGKHYVLEKRSSDASRVRDPETGKRQHLPNEQLTLVEGKSPLVTATDTLPDAVLELLTGVPDERALGLVLEIETGGPTAVRTLLSAYDICESDLHGLLAELQAAGLLTETRVAGERGYETTTTASEALDAVR